MDAAQGEGVVEEAREQFADAAKGTRADKQEAKDALANPGLGDRQPEEEIQGVMRRWREGVVEGVMSLGLLLVNELATTVVLVSEMGEGLALESSESELLAG